VSKEVGSRKLEAGKRKRKESISKIFKDLFVSVNLVS